MSDFREVELKYRADGIKLTVFRKLMTELESSSSIEVSSFDTYFVNEKEEFIRFRNGASKPELTLKRKTKETNNQDRIEINLPINTNNDILVEGFVNLLGYQKNFKIFKSCFIYFFDYVDIVYYSVYDEDMKEEGRFIEIEILEDKIKSLGTEKAFEILKEYEQKLSVLGINPQNRLKKSLFEIFKKD